MVAIGAGIWVLVARDGESDPPSDAGPSTGDTAAVTDPAPDTSAPTTSAATAPTTSTPPTVPVTVEFTLPPAPTDATTTTEPPPPTTEPPPPTTEPPRDPNVRAARRLDAHLADDRAVVQELEGSWVVQLSAKRPGLEADGIRYEMADVLANHEMLRSEYGAVLLFSGDWVYDVGDLYITVIPTAYATGEEALDVCRQLGFDRENCLAKKLTTDSSDENTTEYLP
ncbi:hypothetical protein BH20ACT4_BH20ACT4_11390 [soil metagenome]